VGSAATASCPAAADADAMSCPDARTPYAQRRPNTTGRTILRARHRALRPARRKTRCHTAHTPTHHVRHCMCRRCRCRRRGRLEQSNPRPSIPPPPVLRPLRRRLPSGRREAIRTAVAMPSAPQPLGRSSPRCRHIGLRPAVAALDGAAVEIACPPRLLATRGGPARR